jgi:hypothetical protein
VYSREIDGQVLTMSASSWVYDDTFVLYDYETGSMWYHFAWKPGLTCIAGPLADKFLPELTAKRIRWDQWVIEQPTTKFMLCKPDGLFGFCVPTGK